MAKKIYIGNMIQGLQSSIADLQTDIGNMSTDMAGMVSQLTDISLNTVQSINSLKVVPGNDKAVSLTDVSVSTNHSFSNTGELLGITKPEFKVFCDGVVKVKLDLACNANAGATGYTASFKLQGIIGGAVVANGDFVTSDPFASAQDNPVAFTNVTVDIPVSFGDVVQVGVFVKGSKTGYTGGKDWELSNIIVSYSMTNIISDGAIVET